MAWSLIPMLRRGRGPSVSSRALLVSPVLISRVLLTVATQITFIIAISSSASAVAWPILNSTGILAMALSSVFIKEKPLGPEKWIVAAITALALRRFFRFENAESLLTTHIA
jgi:drug/metabolite transporter (DMT)-like permease